MRIDCACSNRESLSYGIYSQLFRAVFDWIYRLVVLAVDVNEPGLSAGFNIFFSNKLGIIRLEIAE